MPYFIPALHVSVPVCTFIVFNTCTLTFLFCSYLYIHCFIVQLCILYHWQVSNDFNKDVYIYMYIYIYIYIYIYMCVCILKCRSCNVVFFIFRFVKPSVYKPGRFDGHYLIPFECLSVITHSRHWSTLKSKDQHTSVFGQLRTFCLVTLLSFLSLTKSWNAISMHISGMHDREK